MEEKLKRAKSIELKLEEQQMVRTQTTHCFSFHNNSVSPFQQEYFQLLSTKTILKKHALSTLIFLGEISPDSYFRRVFIGLFQKFFVFFDILTKYILMLFLELNLEMTNQVEQ